MQTEHYLIDVEELYMSLRIDANIILHYIGSTCLYLYEVQAESNPDGTAVKALAWFSL